MDVTAPPMGARTVDPHIVKQWAAEDVAIAMGLLRECPYHGQPFRPRSIASTAKALATGVIDPLDPSVQAFNGNTRELLAAIENVTGTYGDHCEVCAASDHDVFD